MTSPVFDKVCKIVSLTFGAPVAALTNDSNPETVAGWDSLNHIHLVVALEEEFGVSFDPEQALELDSVGAIVRAVEELRNGAG